MRVSMASDLTGACDRAKAGLSHAPQDHTACRVFHSPVRVLGCAPPKTARKCHSVTNLSQSLLHGHASAKLLILLRKTLVSQLSYLNFIHIREERKIPVYTSVEYSARIGWKEKGCASYDTPISALQGSTA